jgi:3-hydroxyisobutyrate dehydrogenase-like beta-hydroxyacid dehydrogenase
MGAPQARLIARSGLDLAVYDPFPAALQAFDGIARLATSAADAAGGAEVACVCVRDEKQVNDAVFGVQGLAAGLAPGALLLLHSTVHVDYLRKLEAQLAPHKISLVDAPVTRTRRTDDEPFVLTMLGGEAAAVEKARKVVSSFSTEVLAIGQLGAGMALKISNNLVTWVELVVGMQATSLAKHYGVPYEKLRAVMKANGNLSPTMEGMLDGHQKVPRGVNAEYDAFVTSQAGIGEKDLALAAECGEVAGLNMEFAHRSRDILRRAMLREPQSVG